MNSTQERRDVVLSITLRRQLFRAFTLVELLVVISILGILTSLLLPAFGKAKAKTRTIHCLSNLRQIGTAIHLYADSDAQGFLPVDPRGTNTLAWIDMLQPHLGDVDSVRTCPVDPLARLRKRWKRTSYVLNEYTSGGGRFAQGARDPSMAIALPGGESVEVNVSIQKLSSLRNPSDTFLAFEGSNLGTILPEQDDPNGMRPVYDDHTHPDTWVLGWPHVLADIDPYRHGLAGCYLFADGHAASIPAEKLKKRIENGDNFAVIPE